MVCPVVFQVTPSRRWKCTLCLGRLVTSAQSDADTACGCGVISHGRDLDRCRWRGWQRTAIECRGIGCDVRYLANLPFTDAGPQWSRRREFWRQALRVWWAGTSQCQPGGSVASPATASPTPVQASPKCGGCDVANGSLSKLRRDRLGKLFPADSGFTGGTASSTTAAISGAANAPESVYKTQRTGDFSYQVSGLDPGSCYLVSLHFAELTFATAGERIFDVLLNGVPVLVDFDIFQSAGGKNKAINRFFSVHPDSDGKILIQFAPVVGEAQLSAFSVAKVLPYSGTATSWLSSPLRRLGSGRGSDRLGSRVRGRNPLRFQWRRNGVNISGGTGATYTIAAASLAAAGDYSVVGEGTIASQSGKLTVVGQPVFALRRTRDDDDSDPYRSLVPARSSRWSEDGEVLSDSSRITGAMTNSLVIRTFGGIDAGSYSCTGAGLWRYRSIGPLRFAGHASSLRNKRSAARHHHHWFRELATVGQRWARHLCRAGAPSGTDL